MQLYADDAPVSHHIHSLQHTSKTGLPESLPQPRSWLFAIYDNKAVINEKINDKKLSTTCGFTFKINGTRSESVTHDS